MVHCVFIIAFYLIRQPSSSFINLESVTVFISCIGVSYNWSIYSVI